MELHYKCTMWCKIILPDNATKEDVEKILLEEGATTDDVFDFYDDGFPQWETIIETEEEMNIEENEGYSTMELIDDDGKTIWQNGK